jgi:predicted ATPase
MKLLRLKITDPDGFRSLPVDFEHRFRDEIIPEKAVDEFAPFVCAGRNGSGKSNLLEALAASIAPPGYNTLGASINKITMTTLKKGETIGGIAQEKLGKFHSRFLSGAEDLVVLAQQIERELGDSVEKILLIKAILAELERKKTGG